ncbi:response regulator transcription factor [Marinirhabdus gelatinilytica]|uniref:Regulatory LuxR family protein n=1 Tax=Marinirhabdus gelatinilytica TaxID=1703343 RepID=A0A370Q8R7_9FLAO|nr:LuxR C-terminal-related transcriptional regulator [Marinirhabdus gelatinilytica]RDK84748.1 regulatory LuxR family protein [Marinirhabdus gelatinilytica]
MSYTHKIISILKEAETQDTRLDIDETITIIKALKNVTESKKLIEKTILLLFLVEKKTEKIELLSHRESQIFSLIGLGFSSKEISSLLGISKETVSTHRKNIIKKLKLQGSGKLQKTAIQYTQNKLS